MVAVATDQTLEQDSHTLEKERERERVSGRVDG